MAAEVGSNYSHCIHSGETEATVGVQLTFSFLFGVEPDSIEKCNIYIEDNLWKKSMKASFGHIYGGSSLSSESFLDILSWIAVIFPSCFKTQSS